VVVGFAPIGKAFPGGPQEPGSCLMKKRIHEPRSEKLKGAGTQGLRDAGTQHPTSNIQHPALDLERGPKDNGLRDSGTQGP
jgi:hypothetical protein